MELEKRLEASEDKPDYLSPIYRPKSYDDMDNWLNNLSSRAWLGVLGAYSAGGFENVIVYLKRVYAFNLEKWREKDLRHFFNARQLGEFKSRTDRLK